jgi:hypothetical protein
MPEQKKMAEQQKVTKVHGIHHQQQQARKDDKKERNVALFSSSIFLFLFYSCVW